MLFPSVKTSADCQAFLASRTPKVESRLIQFPITQTSTDLDSKTERTITIYATFYLTTEFSKAKEFWQHTGDGISSRMAERCLIMLGALAEVEECEEMIKMGRGTARNRHYAAKSSTNSIISPSNSGTSTPAIVKKSTGRYGTARSVSASTSALPPVSDSPPASTSTLFDATEDEDVLSRYVEERYGRNLDISLAPVAKLAMRRRIAGVLRESTATPPESRPSSANATRKESLGAELESSRGVEGLTESDVWLYPCGMSAIYHAHQLVMNTRDASGVKQGKSVCFG